MARVVEKIEVTIDGVTHTGFRVIEGTTKLKQTIVYQGKGVKDPNSFKRNEKDNTMRARAKTLLLDFIDGNFFHFTEFLDIDIDL